jgi:ABC-2 type transport system ATP-binding protein
MLTLSHITKRYQNTVVLNDISIDIPAGAVAGIIGPNGAGKSTILKIITGFEQSDSGDLIFEERKLSSFDEKVALFSYMPEHLELYPDEYVADMIAFMQNTTQHKDKTLIETLGLYVVMSKKIKQLSKGYRQRLKLLFALSNRKKIVVLDEPFDGFDPIQLENILTLIRKENTNGRSFILSIHQLSDAEKICDYYILLNEGELVAQGTIEVLQKKFGREDGSLEQLFMAALR